MNEADEEFDRARQKSQGRFRSAFEAIFKKYGQIDEEDDIIDLETGDLIVDNGRMRNSRIIELGDLLRYSDQSSSPSLDSVHNYKQVSPELEGMSPSKYSQPSSPELFSNERLAQRISTGGRDRDIRYGSYHRPRGSAHDDTSQASDNDSGSIDLDFASYMSKLDDTSAHDTSIGSLWKRRRKALRDEDEEFVDYDSSDSLAADQETAPIDMYFTNSIEHYLDRLRQQLSTPRTTLEYSPSTTGQIYDDRNIDSDTARHPGHQLLRKYEIPSSPHTMTSRSSGDGIHTHSRATSPDSSVYSGEYAAISESSIISSTRSHTPHMYPSPTGSVAAEHSFTFEYNHGFSVGRSNGYEVDEESDGPISEEEPIESISVYGNSEQYGYFSDGSPKPFLSDQQNTGQASDNSSPILRRPQPVAPHVFFGRDTSLDVDDGFTPDPQTETAWLPGDKERLYTSLREQNTTDFVQATLDSDDSASIHSGESLDLGQYLFDNTAPDTESRGNVLMNPPIQVPTINHYHKNR
ncbi:hypothetical protein LPJ59_002245 [Coemansia sp. RSA 2399]|nr:hypothetical protein LPJ59_002245 [Coemansia sp. RSA 2399]